MKNYLAALLVSIALFSCEEAETPFGLDSRQFNIQVTSDLLDGSESGWLMLHDLEGNPIDYKAFSNGSQIQFKVETDEKYHLTILKKITVGTLERYNVQTIAGIGTDRNFTLGLKLPGTANQFTPNGEFNVNVAHQEELKSTIISSSGGHISGIANYGGFHSSAKMSLSQHNQNYLASTRSSTDEVRYSLISQPQNGQQINLEFSKMLPYDKVIKISTDLVLNMVYSVKVLEKANGQWKDSYWLNSNMQQNHPSVLEYQIGYLNQYEYYSTQITANLSGKLTAGFTKIGYAPETIRLPLTSTISVTSENISNMMFSSSMDFNNWTGNWRKRDQSGHLSVIWDIWGKDSGFKIKSFPAEFTANHPLFSNLDLFEIFSFTLLQSHREYEDLVKSKYVELNNLEETQHYTLTKTF